MFMFSSSSHLRTRVFARVSVCLYMYYAQKISFYANYPRGRPHYRKRRHEETKTAKAHETEPQSNTTPATHDTRWVGGWVGKELYHCLSPTAATDAHHHRGAGATIKGENRQRSRQDFHAGARQWYRADYSQNVPRIRQPRGEKEGGFRSLQNGPAEFRVPPKKSQRTSGSFALSLLTHSGVCSVCVHALATRTRKAVRIIFGTLGWFSGLLAMCASAQCVESGWCGLAICLPACLTGWLAGWLADWLVK